MTNKLPVNINDILTKATLILQNGNPKQRKEIVAELKELKDKRAVPLLLEALKQPSLLFAAVTALKALGEDVIRSLLTLLEESNQDVRNLTISRLEDLADPRAIP